MEEGLQASVVAGAACQRTMELYFVERAKVCHGKLSKSYTGVIGHGLVGHGIADASSERADHPSEASAQRGSFFPKNGTPILKMAREVTRGGIRPSTTQALDRQGRSRTRIT